MRPRLTVRICLQVNCLKPVSLGHSRILLPFLINKLYKFLTSIFGYRVVKNNVSEYT